MTESTDPTPLENVSREDLIARAATLGLDPAVALVETPELRRRVARAENGVSAMLPRPPVTPTEHLKSPEINGQYLLFVDFEQSRNTDDGLDHYEGDASPLRERIVPPNNFHSANCVTSAVATDPGELCPDLREKMHNVVLDLDVPATVVPSSTPGHGHLYIQHKMTWDDYAELLEVMGRVGLLEEGYVAASLRRGFTTVRLPWVRKQVGFGGMPINRNLEG